MVAKKTILVVILSVTIMGVAVFSFVYFPKNSFAIGIKIADQKIGGFTQEKAKIKLEEESKNFLEEVVNFVFATETNTKTVQTTPKEIGLSFDIEESLKEPFKFGKESNLSNPKRFFKSLQSKIVSLFGAYDFPLKTKLSSETFENFLTENFGRYETLPKNAEIIFDEKNLNFKITTP
ncbi:MAG: peptidoglycan binding domain-containing protein, partial [Patescibacteria group bacterium]